MRVGRVGRVSPFSPPATGGGDTPKSREHLHTVYAQMIDANRENMEQSLKHL